MSNNSLLMYSAPTLKDSSRGDVCDWSEIYKVVGPGVSIIDRFDVPCMPYRFSAHDEVKLKFEQHDMSYAECCLYRASQISNFAKARNLTIGILYSGGIDSTALLLAFMATLNTDELKNIKVFMTRLSINENPKFYYEHIRGKFSIQSSEFFGEYLDDPSYIMVDGEHNDQLFGTDLIASIIDIFGFDYIYSPCTFVNVHAFFERRGMSKKSSTVWFNIINDSAKHCPHPIKTIFDFFWWYNFNFKWQSVYFRMNMRSVGNTSETLNIDFQKLANQHFFSSNEFQNWSIFNPDKKIKKSWSTYKYEAKQFIFNFTRDQEYFDNKLKFPSLANLFFAKNTPVALTDDLRPLFAIDKSAYYTSDNIFK